MTSVKPPAEIPIKPFKSKENWAKWLEMHHSKSTGIWLKISKKESNISSVTYPEAIEAALSYGWIDGQKKPFDNTYWLQKFTPRRQRSIWSKINCEKAELLIKDGKMRPAGLKEVERAKADGRWNTAYESQSKISVPEDLQKALDKNPAAKRFFSTLNSINRYAVLFRIHQAKKPETRIARIEKFVKMLEENKTLHPG
jgi:uncharacterized protein YdeI (YjbR/CyaY-like superfamily)